MKERIRGSVVLVSALLTTTAATLFAISIWANKPRGISIDLD